MYSVALPITHVCFMQIWQECNLRIATIKRITVLIVKILRERAVICRNVFLFLLKLSNRMVDFLDFRLYSVSNILEQNHSQRRS